MWLWRLAFAALQALLVFSYHRLRLLQSECRETPAKLHTCYWGQMQAGLCSSELSLHAGQLGEPDSQTSSSHVNAHSALERSRESAKTVDLIVKVTGDFSVQLFWTDFEGGQQVHAAPQGRSFKLPVCPFGHGDAALLTDLQREQHRYAEISSPDL